MSQPARALHAITADHPSTGVGWEPPMPIAATGTLPAFPVDALPHWLAQKVAAVAEATQTPADLPGCIGLAALSTAAGGRAVVRVRRGWVEPVNIYTVVVMEPSARKSPVFNAMIRPIYALERQLRKDSEEAIAEAQVQRRAAQSLMAQAEKTASTASGVERDQALVEAVEAAVDAARMDIPVEPKLVVDDITPEQVGTVLAEQDGRLAVLSDEGGIFGIIAGRYSGQANAGVFLKAYSGSQLRVDRKGRPSELVERPALTLGLTVQPAIIDELGQTAILRGSGFLARFLYSFPPSLAGRRKSRPDPVPAEVTALYDARLHTIAHTLLGWTEEPAELVFTSAADDLMAELQDDLETRLDPGRGAWAHIGDWGGKFHGQTARLAGLLHVAAHPHNPWEHAVTGETFTQAWRIADYYAQHALACFDQLGADPTTDDARHILTWIERTQPATFTRRELFTALSRGRFRKATDLDGPLALLEDHGHIQQQPPPDTAGRRGRKPSPAYWTHPIYRRAAP